VEEAKPESPEELEEDKSAEAQEAVKDSEPAPPRPEIKPVHIVIDATETDDQKKLEKGAKAIEKK